MRFQDLDLFVAVVEEGSFSSAARRLELSQPAVSARINLLEKDLDVPLVVREARRVVPTPAGQMLYERGKAMLQELQSLREQLQEEDGRPTGPLLLSAGEASGVYVAPLLLGAFRDKYPRVRPVLNIHLIYQTLSDIAELKTRLGILPMIPDDPHLEATPLCQDEVVLVVPETHPFAERESIEPHELIGQPLLTREEHSRRSSMLRRVLDPVGIRYSDLNIAMRLVSSEAIKVAVGAGLGLAFMSTLFLRSAVKGLRTVKIQGIETRRTYQLVRRADHPGNVTERTFWDFCRSEPVQAMLRTEFALPEERT